MNDYYNEKTTITNLTIPIDVDQPTVDNSSCLHTSSNSSSIKYDQNSGYVCCTVSTTCDDDEAAINKACLKTFGCRADNIVNIEFESSPRLESAMNNGLFKRINRTGIYVPPIDSIKFKNGATIVQFSDGTKTVVRPSKNDEFDYEKGVLYALVKRLYSEFDPETGEFTTEGFSRKIGTLVKSALDVDKKKTVDEVLNPEKYAKLKEKAEAEKARIEKIRENHFIRKIKRQARHDAKYDMLREKYYNQYRDELNTAQD